MSAWPAAVARGNGGETATMALAAGVPKAQRCLVAYAAHKLRGVITLQRTLAEVALADPKADAAALREMGERVVAATERQDRLLEALLTLARSECGRARPEPVDTR
jgi:signal transduction histidine kinase